MAIYGLNKASRADLARSISTAFNAAGIVETEHILSGSSYIVKTTMFDFVVYFTSNDATHQRIYTYIGDEYVSGTTILNPKTINVVNSGNITQDSVVIITPKVIAVSDKRHDRVWSAVFARCNVGMLSEKQLAFGFGSSSISVQSYNYTDDQLVFPVAPNTLLRSPTGGYYTADVVLKGVDNRLLAESVDGMTFVTKAGDFSASYIVVGDDVIMPLGITNVMSGEEISVSLLIENGAV